MTLNRLQSLTVGHETSNQIYVRRVNSRTAKVLKYLFQCLFHVRLSDFALKQKVNLRRYIISVLLLLSAVHLSGISDLLDDSHTSQSGRYERQLVWEMASMRSTKILDSHTGWPLWEVPLYFFSYCFTSDHQTFLKSLLRSDMSWVH